MPEVRVDLGDRSYSVLVDAGLIDALGAQCGEHFAEGAACAVITDSTVGPLYADRACASLEAAGFRPHRIDVPAGEASKSMAEAEATCRKMIQAGLDRKAFLVALGGGVVGDLAGFVAAIFYRGIPFVQVPTTIVSQVDSSVGGKTGVNSPEGKNLIGAFHQPAFVLADTDTLKTLADREYREGYGEVIKHAAIRDAEMLPLIDAAAADTERANLGPLIARNVAIKARVVEEDEKETSGTRALLNFGHTIGHAIEATAGYGTLLHGEAISIGMVAALWLSESQAGLDPAGSESVLQRIRAFGLPERLPQGIDLDTVMQKMETDKKFSEGKIRFVLLDRVGSALVSPDISREMIRGVVERLVG